jgi:hypothetical protein
MLPPVTGNAPSGGSGACVMGMSTPFHLAFAIRRQFVNSPKYLSTIRLFL